ncbi:tandem-95 repeat protein [Wenzhouxiangella sediminis]|uniref:Tandem-95 repeat protein n=2 Tax=Wenzhouxiangella sediminis TaxID=1792836 RepID=A0A3E1K707_9GAMM|nr:tandem-95 repeat protein [Wenzhouxiangella sediminis]
MPRPGFAVMILLLGCSSLALGQRDERQTRGRATDTDVTSEGDRAAPSTRPAGNSPPLAVDDSYTTGFGESLTVTASAGLLSNDFDPDGDSINVQSIEAPSFGTLNIATDGSFTYTPDPGASGAEELTYTISDGFETDQGVVTITVEANNPPVAVDDSYTTGFGEVLNVPGTQGLLVNDLDPDGDSINVQSIEAPSFGTLNIATDGSFTYTPDPGFSGTETLTYSITDGFSSVQGEVRIAVPAAIFSDRFEP